MDGNLKIKGPYIPPLDVLSKAAPLEVWDAAYNETLKSPMRRFRAGAALYDPSTEQILSRGCSQPTTTYSKNLASVHAECDCISNSRNLNLSGLWMVLTICNGRGGYSWSSRPCMSCAYNLFDQEIERVVYPERKTSDSGYPIWIVRSEHPEELVDRALIAQGPYARQQRIPD